MHPRRPKHQNGLPTEAPSRFTFATSISMAFRSGLTSFSRNNQIVSMDNYSPDRDGDGEGDLDGDGDRHLNFHSRLTQLLLPLHPSKTNIVSQEQDEVELEREREKEKGEESHLLTLSFLRKLLELLLLLFDGDFASLLPFLSNSKSSSSSTNNPLPDLFLRSFDILNAVSDALESLRSSLRLARIASSSFPHQPHRSRHALSKLLDSPLAARRGDGWSATPQLQAMVGMLHAPRGGETTVVYAMGSMVVLSMWCLVAAFPRGGEEREEAVRFPAAPSQLPWAAAVVAIVENVTEEWTRRGREGERGKESLSRWWSRSSSPMPAGMLGELQRMERVAKLMMEDEVECEKAKRVAASDLQKVCGEAEEELGRLQAVVRKVFHTMVRRRAEMMAVAAKGSFLAHSDGSSTSVAL